jgi:DNA-binding SARP family transcriptional activator
MAAVRRSALGSIHADETLICLLGPFQLQRHGQIVSTITGKVMHLLAMVAFRLGSGLPRDEVIEALWPTQDTTAASTSLNSLIYSLHRKLRNGSADEAAVVLVNGAYYLNLAGGYVTDVVRFDSLVREGDHLMAAGDAGAAVTRYAQAVELYRGKLCIDTDALAVVERERLRGSFLSALSRVANHSLQRGDCESALKHAQRLLIHDPCWEEGHRLVMRACVYRGERARALRQYQLCEFVLQREFGAVPEASTTELFDHIRTNAAIT